MPDTELGEVSEKPKDPQEPKNHGNHHDAIHDPFDLALHWDIAVDKPQQYPDYNKGQYDIDKRHATPSGILSEADRNANWHPCSKGLAKQGDVSWG
jgi:hypothetical protein